MKLTTVIGSVNDNPKYYKFIPIQIKFWKKFGCNFVCVFCAKSIPEKMLKYKDNIILWNRNQDVNSAFLGQNLRMFYPALLNLPDDEMVMMTDMDMLPTNFVYYKNGLEGFKKDDFIYYRRIAGNQIYMCYNAAHPETWAKAFQIKSLKDIENRINEIYSPDYSGLPGKTGWFTDQKVMFKYLKPYPGLKVLNRRIRRLEVANYRSLLSKGKTDFLKNFDDVHFHRSYHNNKNLIKDALKQLDRLY